MRVVAAEDFRAYLGYQPHQFTKGQEIKGKTAVHLLRTGAPVEPADDEARMVLGPSEPAMDELDVDGTIETVMAWVGDDPERALEAHEAESEKDKPRSTLLSRLEDVIDG